jgi:single-stranded-DNA-specific exonuclease
VAIVDGPRVLKDRHLKLSVKQNGRVLRAIQWNAAEREAHLVAKKDAVEIAYTVEENEYMGNKYVELRLEDFR